MKKHTTKYVGLDTHKDTIVIGTADDDRGGEGPADLLGGVVTAPVK